MTPLGRTTRMVLVYREVRQILGLTPGSGLHALIIGVEILLLVGYVLIYGVGASWSAR